MALVVNCVCSPVVSSGCPWMWDNLTCWHPAKIGEVVEVDCPELFSQFISEEDYGELLPILLGCRECVMSLFVLTSTFQCKGHTN